MFFTTCAYQSRRELRWNTDSRRGGNLLRPDSRMHTKWLPLLFARCVSLIETLRILAEVLIKAALCSRGVEVSVLTPQHWPWHRALSSQPVVLGFYWACQLFSLPNTIVCHNRQEFVNTTYSTPRYKVYQVIKHIPFIKLFNNSARLCWNMENCSFF